MPKNRKELIGWLFSRTWLQRQHIIHHGYSRVISAVYNERVKDRRKRVYINEAWKKVFRTDLSINRILFDFITLEDVYYLLQYSTKPVVQHDTSMEERVERWVKRIEELLP